MVDIGGALKTFGALVLGGYILGVGSAAGIGLIVFWEDLKRGPLPPLEASPTGTLREDAAPTPPSPWVFDRNDRERLVVEPGRVVFQRLAGDGLWYNVESYQPGAALKYDEHAPVTGRPIEEAAP